MKPTTASGIPVHCAHARLADVTTLVANPRNPNKHGDAQVALLAKIIRHQGWRAPITISKRSGFVVTGHGRLQAALLLQVEQVPVDEQDFATEADEWAHLAADNRIAELAETDGAMLKDLLGDLDTGAFDMDLTGFDAAELERLINSYGQHDDAPEDSAGREPITEEAARATLCERFGVPPFSVLDARQGYWQDRKRAWLAMGIKSEIGRGGAVGTSARAKPGEAPTYRQIGGGVTVRPAEALARPVIIPLANAGTVQAKS